MDAKSRRTQTPEPRPAWSLVTGRVNPMLVPMGLKWPQDKKVLKWPQDKKVRRAGPGRASLETEDEYAVRGGLDRL